jgi:hypothetical protein
MIYNEEDNIAPLTRDILAVYDDQALATRGTGAGAGPYVPGSMLPGVT